MNLQKPYYESLIFFKRNASTILTCIGAVGVVATAVVAVKDTPKAIKLLEQAEEEKGAELTKLEMVKTAGPVYIPAIAIGTSTLACIFGANILNKKYQAALTSAYTLLDASFKEYKLKVKAIYGDDADTRITESIVKDSYDDNAFTYFSDTNLLFFDYHSMRYFEASLKDIQECEYEFNKLFIQKGCASLNEFYKMIGLTSIDGGDAIGWSTSPSSEYHYGYKWIQFNHEKVTMHDGLECYILTMPYEPHADYLYF